VGRERCVRGGGGGARRPGCGGGGGRRSLAPAGRGGGGGGGGGGDTFNGSCNRFQNALPIDHDVIIVEAQHAKAFAGKISISAGVAFLLFWFEGLSPINLDNQPCGGADEIPRGWGHLMLAAETRPVPTTSTPYPPHDSL